MSRSSLPDLQDVKRVLIIRGSAIGDVIHATPISAALKEAFPHLEITWIAEEICGDVVTGNPYLHEVIVTPRSRWKQGRLTSPRIWSEYLGFLRALRARRFDVTLDLQGYAKSAILVLAANAPYKLGWWRQRDGANLVSTAIPRRPQSAHRVDWFLDVARALNAEPQTVRFPLHVPDEARTYIQTLLRDNSLDPGRPYAVLNQAAGDPARRWTETGFAHVAWQLARDYGLPSVLVGVEQDRVPNETIIRQYRELANASCQPEAATNINTARIREPLDLAGQTDLKQLFALVEGCALQISGDTGSLHIADALNRPLVGLFGSSDPAHAGPFNQKNNVVAHRNLCRPDCTVRECAYVAEEEKQRKGEEEKRGRGEFNTEQWTSTCGQTPNTARCLEAITPSEVMAKVAEGWQAAGHKRQ